MILLRFLNLSKLLKIFSFFVFGALVGGLVLFVILTIVVFWVRNEYHQRVYPGIFLFSTQISGRTGGQLDDFLMEKEKEISQRKVIFLWQNKTEKRWEVTPSMINFALDKGAIANEAFSKGRTNKLLADLIEIYKLLVFPQTIQPKFAYNPEKLELIVSQMGLEIDRPAQDALFEFKLGKVTEFQVSKEGRSVGREGVKSLITLAFTQGPSFKPLVALDLPVKTITPKITTSSTNSLGINQYLGEGESFFKDSIPSRVHNIILASSYLHGIVVAPGDVFSFAEKIGTVSAETGYQKAYVIKEKKTILEDGGGVCQVSTTMFRAALNAGLPIIERYPHYYRVGFYEQGGYPPGLDATVYPPSPDLKFKNDTPAYILIQTKIDKDKKRLAFEFYGTSDGRRAEIEKPIVHSRTPPPEPVYIDDPTLPVGTVKRVDRAHWGAKVSFKWQVWKADGQLKEERTFWSNYIPWPEVYMRGAVPAPTP